MRFQSARTVVFALLAAVVAGGFAFIFFQSTYAQFEAPCDTPPNCQPQGQNAGARLFDVLDNGPLAPEFGSTDGSLWRGLVGIGGAAGRVLFGVGTSTPGYPLDVVGQMRSDQTDSKDTMVARLGYSTSTKVYTGLRLDRKAGDQKWFAGMNDAADNFIIRRNGTTDDVTIDTSGNVQGRCMGSFVVGMSGPSNGAAQGYAGANAKCNQAFAGSHACTTQEILKTVQCIPSRFDPPGISTDDIFNGGWINNGPPGYTALSNDCEGWTNANDVNNPDYDSENPAFGTYWSHDANGGKGLTDFCEASHKFFCCK